MTTCRGACHAPITHVYYKVLSGQHRPISYFVIMELKIFIRFVSNSKKGRGAPSSTALDTAHPTGTVFPFDSFGEIGVVSNEGGGRMPSRPYGRLFSFGSFRKIDVIPPTFPRDGFNTRKG